MNEERKSSAWPWVVAMLVALLVGYPLSYGPAWRLSCEGMLPQWLEDAYIPVNVAWQNCPGPVWLAGYWYLNLWMPPDDAPSSDSPAPRPADCKAKPGPRSDAVLEVGITRSHEDDFAP